FWWRSTGHWHWHGKRVATAFRYHYRRRSDRLPDSDALHNAGRLPVLRQDWPQVSARQEGQSGLAAPPLAARAGCGGLTPAMNSRDPRFADTPHGHTTERNRQMLETDLAEVYPPPDSGQSGVNFSAPFIDRPVATSLLSGALIPVGILAYALLPVASVPQVEFPAISVSASLPGADPETMASAVATPLERQFSRIAGINEMTSASSAGGTSI